MITGVAFCPQAPALDPEVGRGLDREFGPLRAACRDAIRSIAGAHARLEVLAAPDAAPIADWLVHDAGLTRSAASGPDTALLVIGDGSARRTEKAPGYLDKRAEPFDREVAAALGSGDPARLAALDATLGADLLAAGVPAWHEAATRLDGAGFDATVLYDDAPFGVGYVVATWVPRAEH